MRIAVIGSGGVGGFFGGRLAQAGEEVIFIARGDHLKAMQTAGLRVESIKGDFYLPKVQASDDPEQIGTVDIVLLAVKTWQAEQAIQAIRPMVGKDTGVVPLGNGIDPLEQLVRILGKQHSLGGLCRISSFLIEPGLIRHVGLEPDVLIGELDNQRTPRLEALLAAFQRAGISVSVPEDIQVAMWDKFIFIAAISGLGAATRAPIGVFRNLPGTRRLLIGLLGEIESIARARQIDLPHDFVGHTLDFIDSMNPNVMASMQRDIMEGRPSELEAQNGAVVRMGIEAGFPTPLNEFIYNCLLPQELKARGQL